MDDRFNVLLTGGRAGRASLLRATQERLTERSGPADVVFAMSAARISQGAELASFVARSLATRQDAEHVGGTNATSLRDDHGDPLATLARAIAAHRNGTVARLVILIDDVLGAAGHTLFGSARDQVWEMGALWIVAADAGERPALLLPPADEFYARSIEL